MSTTSEIRIRVGEVEVSCPDDVDPARLEAVFRSIAVAFPKAVLPDAAEAEVEVPTIRDFLRGSSAKTHGEKAGVVAYWLEEHQKRSEWRTGDILDALEEAGEPQPANLTDALNQKAKKGLFEVNDRRWKLTGEGRGWVKYSLLPRSAD